MPVVIDGSTGITSPGGDVSSANNTVNGVSVGRGAGNVSTNTAVGASALATNSSGARTTAFGYEAGFASTGDRNTFIGFSSGRNHTGSDNTTVGDYALQAAGSGSYNTAMGQGALFSTTSGANNTAIGFQALVSNTTASNNTAVGYQSLFSNTTGDVNTAVGFQAAYSTTTGVWITAVGKDALRANTTGGNNTAVGRALVSNTTASDNTAVGFNNLYYNTTGTANTAVGSGALFVNTTGNNNTAIGYQSGYSNTTGATNAFIGAYSGYYTTGSSNTFVGISAGESITSGQYNVVIGRYNGNQSGLDIRTSSYQIVLSNGAGNPVYLMRADGGSNTVFEQEGAYATNLARGSFIRGDTNVTQSLLAVSDFAFNAGVFIKVRILAVSAVSNNTCEIIGYAQAYRTNGGAVTYVTSSCAIQTNSAFGGSIGAGTLSWSSNTLQYSTNSPAYVRYSMYIDTVQHDSATVTYLL